MQIESCANLLQTHISLIQECWSCSLALQTNVMNLRNHNCRCLISGLYQTPSCPSRLEVADRYEITTSQEGNAHKKRKYALTEALVVVGGLANNLQICEGSRGINISAAPARQLRPEAPTAGHGTWAALRRSAPRRWARAPTWPAAARAP